MLEQVILLLVGGMIGFLSSIGMYIVERFVDRKGRIKVYYRFINHKNDQKSWGIRDHGQEVALLIPAVFELQNTSNSTRVIRDLNAELYDGKSFVAKMIQIECSVNTHTSGGKVKSETTEAFGTENGSYSFVLPPRSIQKQRVEFLLRIPKEETEKKQFNRIDISYYDEMDKKHSYIAKLGLDGWNMTGQVADNEWILLDR